MGVVAGYIWGGGFTSINKATLQYNGTDISVIINGTNAIMSFSESFPLYAPTTHTIFLTRSVDTSSYTNFYNSANTYRLSRYTYVGTVTSLNFTWNATISLSKYRNEFLGNESYYDLYYVGKSTSLDWNYLAPMSGGQVFNGFDNLVPVIPAIPLFTATSSFDCYAAEICITNGSANVQRWNIFRSATSGGTFVQIGTWTPADGLCFIDYDVECGETYCYKVSAVNLPWEELNPTPQCVTITDTTDDTCVIRNVGTVTNGVSGDTTSDYQLWRSTAVNGTYIRVGGTHTGNTVIQDKMTTYGATYWYKVAQITPNWTQWSTPTQYTGTLSMPLAPVLTGTSNTGTTSIDLSWTDANQWYHEYEIYQQINGGGFTLIATVTGNTYNVPLVPNVIYDFYIRGKISCFAPTYIYSPFSNQTTISVIPLITPPIQSAATNITCTGATLNWINTNVSGVTGNYIKKYVSGTTYIIIATVASGDTSYNLTGLTPITTGEYAIVAFNVGRQAKSNNVFVTTLDPAPFNLVANVNVFTCTVTWQINDPPYGTAIRPEIRIYSSTVWTTKPLIAKNATSYTFTGLQPLTTYEARFVRIGSEYPSLPILFTTPAIPPPFCSGTNYELTEPATCGNSDGVMWIEDLRYFTFYDFTLTDTFGNSYMPNLTTGEFTGLAGGWYTLSVTPFPEYQYLYGNEPCVIEWLPVPDINTTVTLTDTKIRHAVCGGFGNSIGRIVFQFTDSNIAATGWTFSLYTANGVRVNQQQLTSIANVVYNARPNEYYAILENNFGCTCLVDLTQVLAERLYTVTEITDVYLTPWSSAVEYNYYDNTNENWYVAGIDTQQFTSSMIAEYLNLPEPWYEIGIHTAVATYNQNLNKGSNGIVYQEEFRISVPHQDNQKWKDLVNVLSKRYIIVFRDAHGFYWTMGFRNGCEVKAYQLQDNQYQISFIHPAVQQLLTSMDENYVKYSIL